MADFKLRPGITEYRVREGCTQQTLDGGSRKIVIPELLLPGLALPMGKQVDVALFQGNLPYVNRE